VVSVTVVPEDCRMPFPYAPWGDENELNRVLWYLADRITHRAHYLVYIYMEAEFPELRKYP